jgi:glycine betaine/proline transport system ATP-binding protein
MPANQPATPKIECSHLWKVFGPQPHRTADAIKPDASRDEILAQTGHLVAVRDISFQVGAGETFVVMGLSGSGKSTLLRCLPRLIEPTRGQVLIDGADVTTLDETRLRNLRRHKMSMVFQNFGLFPHRRVLDNVAYGLEIQGVGKDKRYKRAREVIELVNLKGWERHYPGQLSGGMQQRVGLARALAVDPEILLFDEPFSALDPLIRREMQDELLHLQTQMQRTIIFITHDFAEATKMADAPGGQIAIMKDGAFVQVGAAEHVVLRPVNDYVAEFTKDVPRARVLTARTIMQPIRTTIENSRTVLVTLKLDDLLPLVAATDAALPVVDEEDNLVGCIDRTSVMLALAGETHAPGPSEHGDSSPATL